jgi:hypothetical protein
MLLAFVAVLSASACWEDEDERYDVGYDDGYATGYNTTCKIRATLIEGDWNSEAYSRGYNVGHADGSAACQAAEN